MKFLKLYIPIISIITIAHAISVQRELQRYLMDQLRDVLRSSPSQYLDHQTLVSIVDTLEMEKEECHHRMIQCVHRLHSTSIEYPAALDETNKILSQLDDYVVKYHELEVKVIQVRAIVAELCGRQSEGRAVRRYKRQHWSRGLCGLQPGK